MCPHATADLSESRGLSLPLAFAGPQLADLVSLDLAGCAIAGRVPDFGACARLELLDLSVNRLGGPVPLSLGALKARQPRPCRVDLRFNLPLTLSADTAPVRRTRLLDLSSLSCGGELPLEVIRLALYTDRPSTRIKLGNNKPGFTLPEDLGELRRGGRGDVDCVLNLANSSLIGAVPASISMLQGLRALFLQNNQLHDVDAADELKKRHGVNVKVNDNKVGMGDLDLLAELSRRKLELENAIETATTAVTVYEQ